MVIKFVPYYQLVIGLFIYAQKGSGEAAVKVTTEMKMIVVCARSPISASQSSLSAGCVSLPFKKPFEEDSVTPLEMWSSSISTSLLCKAKHLKDISH